MKAIDLNADIGEADNAAWAQAEVQILTVVSSANIACGGHAGDAKSMRTTLRAAKAKGINVGAHPSYPDRKNFGRKSLILERDISTKALKESLAEQIISLVEIAADEGVSVNYVKPHGALYNDAVTDTAKANLIVETVKEIDPRLTLLGGPNSEMMVTAQKAGLNFIAEGFIDRRYTDDGHLLSRIHAGAVLDAEEDRIAQALSLATQNIVKTNTGKSLFLRAQSLCLHGDSKGIVGTARHVRTALEAAQMQIRPFLQKDL